MKSDALPNESFRQWLDRVNNRTREASPCLNGQQPGSEKTHQRSGWVLSSGLVEHQACANGTGNQTGHLRDVGDTATNFLQRQKIEGHISANGITCSSVRSSIHSSATSRENNDRKGGVNSEKLHPGNSTLDLRRSDNSLSIHQLLNLNSIGNGKASSSVELTAVQSENFNEGINGNANDDHDGSGLVAGLGHAGGLHVEEIDPNIPAWASATPVDGYIMHPAAGLVMHPSFYDNRHLIELATQPRYIYDGEVDGPLCPVGKKCDHIKNCFEVRVRMAVLAYQRHHISFRDAEYIWSVSRSTIQRRKAAMEKSTPLIFLLTPENTAE